MNGPKWVICFYYHFGETELSYVLFDVNTLWNAGFFILIPLTKFIAIGQWYNILVAAATL